MDQIRSISAVSIAQFMVLGALSPVFAETSEEDFKHHRHGRGQAPAVSHERQDYPVIFNWLSSPEPSEPAANPSQPS